MWNQNLFDHTRRLCVHVLSCATQQCCISSLSRFPTTRFMYRDAISCLEILDHLGFSRHIRWDSLAEWFKAPDLGFGPKWRGFKSHSHHNHTFSISSSDPYCNLMSRDSLTILVCQGTSVVQFSRVV